MYAVVPVASAIHIRTCSYRLDALKERHQINIFKQAWVLSFVILGGSVIISSFSQSIFPCLPARFKHTGN